MKPSTFTFPLFRFSLFTVALLLLFLEISACTRAAPPGPQPLHRSWEEFEGQLKVEGFRLISLARGNFAPGSIVSLGPEDLVSGLRKGHLSQCIETAFPQPTESDGGKLFFVRSGLRGINIDLGPLKKLFSFSAEGKGVSNATFNFKQTRWSFIEQIPLRRWFNQNADRLSEDCKELIANEDLHVVSQLLLADFKLDFTEAGKIKGGVSTVKKFITINGQSIEFTQSNVESGGLVPFAVVAEPLSKFYTPAPPPSAPFKLSDDEKRLIHNISGEFSIKQVWNSSHETSAAVNFVVQKDRLLMISKTEGKLRPGADNPRRLFVAKWAGKAGAEQRVYLDSQRTNPIPITEGLLDAAFVPVSDRFTLHTVRSFPYVGCDQGQSWVLFPIGTSHRHVSSLTVRVYSAGPPLTAAGLYTLKEEDGYTPRTMPKVTEEKLANLDHLLALLREVPQERALAQSLSELGRRGAVSGWELKKDYPIPTLLLVAFPCLY